MLFLSAGLPYNKGKPMRHSGGPPPRVLLIDHSSYWAVAAHTVDVPQVDL